MDDRVITTVNLNPDEETSKSGCAISKQLIAAFGVTATLEATDYNGPMVVCYAIEGNTVDRASCKNGKGWCEGISPTLNTQDKHAVVYGVDCRNGVLDEEKTHTIQAKPQGGVSLNCTPSVVYSLEGNGARPSHQGNGYSDEGKMFTLNTIEKHAVCYDARGNGDGQTVSTLTGDHQNRVTDYTTIIIDHSRRHSYQPLDTVPTLEAAMGTGGGNVPLVMVRRNDESLPK